MAKQSEIEVGQHWVVRVGGNIRVVEITKIIQPDRSRSWNVGVKVKFGMRNISTNRELSPRTSAFFRKRVK